MRVIGVDDVLSVASAQARHGLQRFDSCEQQRNEENVEPYRRQHEGPEGNALLARLDQSGKTEMSRDHCWPSLELQRGHGSPASSQPITTTKRMTPRINCISALT